MTSLETQFDTSSLEAMLQQGPYASYAYSYPHKMAYRRLDPPVALDELWAQENRDSLFLYLHVPFCEMRCGFCNLFTTTNRQPALETEYLTALETQAQRVRAVLGSASFARLAIGGGTPTFLQTENLRRLFEIAETIGGADPHHMPVSVETSPETSSSEKLHLLRERGVDRVSIGVQSFAEAEVHAVGRAQKTISVEAALQRIRDAGFPTLNIDLMYGLPGQTVESWLASLRAALRFEPEEIYLYPLYVRPLTGLGRRVEPLPHQMESDIRLTCYREGRALLLAEGYLQVSMRMFRRSNAPALDGPVYCCQEDGMVGLGCGARSYTSSLHYSTEYAVGASTVRGIMADYVKRPAESFDVADYGFRLDADEQRRRYIIQSLLQLEGLSFDAYYVRFGSHAIDDMLQLYELELHSLAEQNEQGLVLTAAGIEMSDVIGPWLGSALVRGAMATFTLR